MNETVTHAPHETQAIAAGIAERLGAMARTKAAIVTLRGDLGAGKTTFTQGLLAALGVTEYVTSPTFTLVQRYPLSTHGFANAYHIDAYRLEGAADLDSLDLAGPLQDPSSLVIVEWPEVAGDLLIPTVDVLLAHGEDELSRTVTVTWNS